MQKKDCCAEVFTFVDTAALTGKLAMWKERDKAIRDGYERFNNKIVKKYAADSESQRL